MKKLISILLISFSLSCGNSNEIYICTGPYSHAYHTKKDCYGLSRCSTDIKEVSKEDAIEKWHRTPCRYCNK